MNTSRTTKLFIRNLTVLDVAALLPYFGPRGRSWYVDVVLEGETDEEGILLDFSAAKKTIKKVIDDSFDHKLLTGKSFAQPSATERILVRSAFRSHAAEGDFRLDAPASSVCLLNDSILEAIEARGDTQELSQHMASVILKHLEKNVRAVVVTLREHELYSDPSYFSYTHSLRFHKGNCQRFHGHSNIVEVFDNGKHNAALSIKAADLLKEKYLIAPEYQKDKTSQAWKFFSEHQSLRCVPENHSCFEYEGTQGVVRILLPTQSVCILPAESTIENISRYVHRALELSSTQQVYAYEGLLKGAIS